MIVVGYNLLFVLLDVFYQRCVPDGTGLVGCCLTFSTDVASLTGRGTAVCCSTFSTDVASLTGRGLWGVA